MVANIHYRWDFIGLSTDQKPTPATSPKVVDGSTYYCSDNSKLYVFYKDTWYEKTAQGGGTSYTAGAGINISDGAISVDTTTIQPKLTAGSNITITDNTIAATDTTYSAFVGTDGTSAGSAGLVPAPATTDAGKFLKADGTWEEVSGKTMIELTTADYNWNNQTYTETNPNCVALWKLDPGIYYRDDSVTVTTQKAGGLDRSFRVFIIQPSIYDANQKECKTMFCFCDNQGATRRLLVADTFNITDLAVKDSIQALTQYDIYGNGSSDRVQIGSGALSSANGNIAIGKNASSTGNLSTAIGRSSTSSANGAVAIGHYSSAATVGQFDIGSTDTSYGYNSSNYRLLTGLYDPQSAHDASTKGYVDSSVSTLIALTTTDPGEGATLAEGHFIGVYGS